MSNFYQKGFDLRKQIKELIILFMSNESNCMKTADGESLSFIFRECGLNWGDYENATSGQQRYYGVAAMRELEKEGKVQRDEATKKWRLK